MTPRDIQIAAAMGELIKVADSLAANGEETAAAHVYNAILNLRRAYSAEYRAYLDWQDLAVLNSLRASYKQHQAK